VRRLEKGGTILGVFNEAMFEDETVQLDRGDTLVVFSDGVTEALDAGGSEFGEERLLSCVMASHELELPSLLKCVLDAVRDFCAGTSQSDDLTVLVLRYTGV
jgi:sigma-B regulation protein RsbU (phosphoserine phosphatase)